ncbi:MAG: T9SS type A sorting domain-containing protein [Bacteroidetes bacterium]|nr:T9SS type A sorting domain-containing protein [Bacteroidota bacterium]
MVHSKALCLFIFAFILLPLSGQETDSSIVSRSPYDVSDSLMFAWVPDGMHDSIPAYTGSSIFTTDYQPSGSYWDKDCDEEDVFLARLIHKEADSVHWNLGVGRAGIIYSFIGPYGEGVPPQVHGSGDFNLAPWIDEVWQIVSVNSNLNNHDRIPAPPGSTLATTVRSMPYFIHGAGAYRNDTMFARLPAPFYSPFMSSWYNPQEKALYTTNWGTQAHIPSLHKSQLLYTYKYKDLGNGIMENTMVIQNFGDVHVHYHNMPWGGVRASNLPQVWLSKPDHSLERSYKTFGGENPGILSSLDLTGGYMIWAAEGDDEDRPAMALVYGYEKHKVEYKNKYNMSFNRLRWGLTGNVDRSYTVFVLNPKIDIKRGNSFYYRIYYINGTFREVHEKAKKIADAPDYGMIHADHEQAQRTVIKPADHFSALKEDIELFAEPVPNNIPLFLMENTKTGIRYISPDLYHDVPTQPFVNPYDPSDPKYETYQNRIVYRQYDGTIKYIRLLGYGVSSRDHTPNIRYRLLDSMVLDPTRIVIPESYKNKVWIPAGACDSCSVGLDPEPLPSGAELYSDFGENRIYEAQDLTNLEYTHNVVNPAKSDVNPSHLCGKVSRLSGEQSRFFFEVPGSIELTGAGTFRIRVYYESDAPIPDPCNVGIILKNKGDESTQMKQVQNVSVANEWVEYRFNFHHNFPPDDYNQVWIYFSSPDNENQAVGQTFYIDELTGPVVNIPEIEYQVTFRLTDKLSNEELRDASLTIGQQLELTDAAGEAAFSLSEGTYTYSARHPDFAGIDSSLQLRKDTVVQLALKPLKKHVRFSIYSDNMEKVLSGVSVKLGETELLSGLNGSAIFDVWKGSYAYTLSHPDYFTLGSTIEVSGDTTVLIILLASKATLKFRVYSQDKPLNMATLQLNNDSLNTSQTGIALFQDLPRFEEYDWSVSKKGYESVTGLVKLENDTTVNVSMNLLSHAAFPGLDGLRLYPNPASTRLFIESPVRINRVELCDLRAAVLYNTDTNVKNLELDISVFPAGIYVAHIYRDGLSTLSLKVVKSK